MGKFRHLDYEVVEREIKNSSEKTAIYIGCDSKLTGPYTIFGLVIILHIESCKGGMAFAMKMKINRRMDINERLMKETEYAFSCANLVKHWVGNRLFEVHLDLNEEKKHKSNKVMASAVGWIESLGIKCEIKPNAWAASTAADYIIK
jgi:predicted RNase H-related nuclease YkuK (DUF458 family)